MLCGNKVDPRKRVEEASNYDLSQRNKEAIREAQSFIQRHMVDLDPTPQNIKTCLFTCTKDANFILDRVELQNGLKITIAGGFSGHGFIESISFQILIYMIAPVVLLGFKFAPSIGKINTNSVLGNPQVSYFSLFCEFYFYLLISGFPNGQVCNKPFKIW